QILFQETDDSHGLGIKELIKKLQDVFPERSFDHRTIKHDLQTLDDTGFEVIQNKGKYGKILYSHQGRLYNIFPYLPLFWITSKPVSSNVCKSCLIVR